MAASFLFAIFTVALILCGSAMAAHPSTVHEPATAGHTPGPLDSEASASRWPWMSSLAGAAAAGLGRITPFRSWSPAASPLPPAREVPQGDGWEARFARGLHFSNLVVEEADESMVRRWVVDRDGSGAGVPAQMLEAEELLLAAGEAPEAKQKEKTAERALRVYNHAKWLAERNLAKAARAPESPQRPGGARPFAARLLPDALAAARRGT